MKFLKKLHLACGEEDNKLHYIFFVGEFIYVCNGFMLIKQHYSLHNIELEDFQQLDGRVLSSTMFQEALKAKEGALWVEGDNLKWQVKAPITMSCPLEKIEDVEGLRSLFSQLEGFIPTEEQLAAREVCVIPRLGLNPALLTIAGQVTFNVKGYLEFDYLETGSGNNVFRKFVGQGIGVTESYRNPSNQQHKYLECIVIMGVTPSQD